VDPAGAPDLFVPLRASASSTGDVAARRLFKRAIEIDPKFAMAHAWLGRLYGNLGEYALAAESTSKAYQLRDRASDTEKFFITASYDIDVTGNLEKAQQSCEARVYDIRVRILTALRNRPILLTAVYAVRREHAPNVSISR
jgi:tetratricopeptide (TPR) repeat protein